MKLEATRRRFLQGVLGMLGSAAALAVGWRHSAPEIMAEGKAAEGYELYGDWVILPDGAPLPPFVDASAGCGIPIMEQLPGGPPPTAIVSQFESDKELASSIDFPVYRLKDLPSLLRPTGGSIVRNRRGQVFSAGTGYEAYDSEHDTWFSPIGIEASEVYPRPCPIWHQATDTKGSTIAPVKVDFLPSPGLMTVTARGYVFHWIANGIRYSMRVESGATLAGSQGLAKALTVISK